MCGVVRVCAHRGRPPSIRVQIPSFLKYVLKIKIREKR